MSCLDKTLEQVSEAADMMIGYVFKSPSVATDGWVTQQAESDYTFDPDVFCQRTIQSLVLEMKEIFTEEDDPARLSPLRETSLFQNQA